MSDLVKGFKILSQQYKGPIGRLLKATAVELFLEQYKADIISRLGGYLHQLNPVAVPDMVRQNVALPVPESLFEQCIGFEDFIENFPVDRFFEEFLAPANPLIAAAIIDMEDDGADYLIKFKQFFVDSVKAKVAQRQVEEVIEETPPEPASEATQEVKEEKPAPSAPLRVAPHVKIAEAAAKVMKRLTCDKCHESWDVPEDKVASIKECPFCHSPA